MGAKVEAEGYKLGHYAVGNLQAGINGWRSSYEEETSNGEFCNGFMTTEAVGYSDYDREMFKRTMLAHEAAFRQQVPFNYINILNSPRARRIITCSNMTDNFSFPLLFCISDLKTHSLPRCMNCIGFTEYRETWQNTIKETHHHRFHCMVRRRLLLLLL
jgi:hypothetical protein